MGVFNQIKKRSGTVVKGNVQRDGTGIKSGHKRFVLKNNITGKNYFYLKGTQSRDEHETSFFQRPNNIQIELEIASREIKCSYNLQIWE
jgi:hypothetical protein